MNRSRDTAMNLDEPIERLDRVRIAQNDGDLPPLCTMRGLTLCAGLGLGHSGVQRVACFDDLVSREHRPIVSLGVQAEAAQDFGAVERHNGGWRSKCSAATGLNA